MRNKALSLTLVLAFLLSLCSCGIRKQVPSASKEIFAMDTYMTITCYGENCEDAVNASVEEINRLDNLLSIGKETSEISKLNESGSAVLSDDSITMIKEAIDVYQKTNGAFDITVYPLMVAWGFTTQDFTVPEESTIQELLSYMGCDKLQLNEEKKTLVLGKHQGIDLGGIAKGYASDQLIEIFKKYDLAAGLISLGGNVQTYKTNTDGSRWRCGITNPADPEGTDYLGILNLEDQAAVTSGAYQRNFTDEKTGKTYHHIIDPATGYSADSGLTSVTIICPKGIVADALSTSFYVMGLEKATEYWHTYGAEDHFEFVVQTEDGTVYATSGIADQFEVNDKFNLKVVN